MGVYGAYEWFGIEFQGLGFPDEAAEGFSSAVLNGAGVRVLRSRGTAGGSSSCVYRD